MVSRRRHSSIPRILLMKGSINLFSSENKAKDADPTEGKSCPTNSKGVGKAFTFLGVCLVVVQLSPEWFHPLILQQPTFTESVKNDIHFHHSTTLSSSYFSSRTTFIGTIKRVIRFTLKESYRTTSATGRDETE